MSKQFQIAARMTLADEASEAIINFNHRVFDVIKPATRFTRSLRDVPDNIGLKTYINRYKKQTVAWVGGSLTNGTTTAQVGAWLLG